MGYTFADIDALHVPGRTDLDELGFLGALANQVRPGGRIVEVGSFFGRTTCVMAQANPRAQVIAIDTFQEAAWTRRYTRSSPAIPNFSKSAFDKFTRGFPNISSISGASPESVSDWTQPIDMYFEDAVHGNPSLKNNLDFWKAHLRPGGILCGHDYGHRFPDVKREVDAIAKTWNVEVRVVGSLWALQKPGALCDSVKEAALVFSACPPLKLQGENKRRGRCSSGSGFWLGAHLEADRLNWISVEPEGELHGRKLEIRLGHPEFGQSAWQPAENRNRLIFRNKLRPFSRFAMRVADTSDNSDHQICYRVSARQIGKNGHIYSGTSQWSANGAWAHVYPEGPAINAITVTLAPIPLSSQNAFPKSKAHQVRSAARSFAKRVLK